MTNLLQGGLARTIGKAMSGLFLDATLTRDGPTTGPAYDPVPGAPVTYACRGMVEKYSAYYRANSLVGERDRKVLLLANGLGTRPLPGDRVTIQGVAFTLQEVATDPANAIWECRGQM